MSLDAVVAELERQLGRPVALRHENWRPADQLYFVADTRAFEAAVGWRARVGWRDGLGRLVDWLGRNRAPEDLAMRASA